MTESWRDRIKVHPAAEMFPMMADDELSALAKDIAENGLRQGIVLWTPEQPRFRKAPLEIYLLDGRNRLAAIERCAYADAEERDEAIECALTYRFPAARRSGIALWRRRSVRICRVG
jgi:hypothetical protein